MGAEIQVPEDRAAYRGAHFIADTAFAAAQVRHLTEEAKAIGFGPKDQTLNPEAPIRVIAHQIGSIIEDNPDAATPWPAGTERPLTQ